MFMCLTIVEKKTNNLKKLRLSAREKEREREIFNCYVVYKNSILLL